MSIAEKIESAVAIDEIISKLPVKEKVVIALRLAGYTQRECGVMIGMTRSAVGIIYKRAINLLRGLIGGILL